MLPSPRPGLGLAGLVAVAGLVAAAAGAEDPALSSLPSDGAALGGYSVLIADRGNNRLLLVTPDKQVVWHYEFTGIRPRHGADDAFFADGGRSIITNLEYEHVIQIIDMGSKAVTWQYGELGKPGPGPNRLNFPDDAYQLPNGNVVVADIRNCRVIEITPDKTIARQLGVTGNCGKGPGLLASPNGDTPLPNGHLLISTIRDHSLLEVDENWDMVLKLSLPLKYPSDPQQTMAGNFLVSDYTHPGKIIEITRDGEVVWEYTAENEGQLDHPSLALELPNGNILANDDLNHRVIVIDKADRRIVWQYGVTGHAGDSPGYLSIPDGVDITKNETAR